MEKQYSAAYWKQKLQLESHVEGGAFKEVYRSEMMLKKEALTDSFSGDRNASTSIYFLLEYGEFSAFHRIASDELWHLYDGGGLTIYEIDKSGVLHKHKLGKKIDDGEEPQVVIKAGSWFASRVEEASGYALCGCTVAPGFDFTDFELADRRMLTEMYPMYKDLITELTND